MSQTINTDAKLLLLLSGGELLKNLIDPYGLFSKGLAISVVMDYERHTWKLKTDFPEHPGASTLLAGHYAKGSGYIIETVLVKSPGKEYESVPFEPGKGLIEGLGNLSRVPVHLRRLLAPIGGIKAEETEIKNRLSAYWKLLDGALIWDTEPKNPKEPLENFTIRRLDYEYDEDANPSWTKINAICSLEEGQITLSAEAGIYGLSAKKVTLEKNLGMLRSAHIDCWAKKENHRRPSIKAAFDLYWAIPVLYEKQRRKKKDMGKPKAR